MSLSIMSHNESMNYQDAGVIPRMIDYAELRVQECSESHVMTNMVAQLHAALESVGVPQHNLPSAISVTRSLVATGVTLLVYYLFWGKRHVKRRRLLAQELQIAEAKLKYLQEKLMDSDIYPSRNSDAKEIRIFMDGAFDLLHYGHMNAFRLGRSLGTHLVVGVNSDESITACKGAPLMNDQERLTMVESCKFVDEVVPGCPYIMTEDYVNYVIDKYNIDYVIHGDDPCIVDGKDVYAAAKKSGKYLSIPRTEGVSTTDIVGRMLLMTKEHHYHDGVGDSPRSAESTTSPELELLGRQSKFLTTSRMLRLFSAGTKSPTEDMRIIYIDGAWDMFHCGHVAILKAAKEVRVFAKRNAT
jgi:ethanolamine-phosphate cytidylyltransferase